VPIDQSLPALHRRRSHLAVLIANKSEIVEAATLDDKGIAAFIHQIQQAQAEFDELEYLLESHDRHDAPKIPIHPTIFVVALGFWAIVTVMAVYLLR